jgi:hypothetical protein
MNPEEKEEEKKEKFDLKVSAKFQINLSTKEVIGASDHYFC